MTLTWSSSTDWDASPHQRFVVSRGDYIEQTYGTDSFEDIPTDGSMPSVWNPQNTSINEYNSSDGSQSVFNSYDANPDFGITDAAFYRENIDESPDQITFAYWEGSNSGGCAFVLRNSGNSPLLYVGSRNPYPFYNNDNLVTTTEPDPANGEFRRFTITIDWANNQYDLLWEDVTGNSPNYTVSNIPFLNASSQIGAVYGSSLEWEYNSANWKGDEMVDEVYGVFTDGELRSSTKTESSSTTPNLSNLSYSRNDGAIDVEVVGSPGTASEERKSRILDGSTSYDLSWSSGHTEFRVDVAMSMPSRTGTPPTLSALTLVDPVPDSPTGVTATAVSTSQTDLSWDDPGSGDYAPDSWNIYRAVSSGSSLSDYSLVDTTTSIGYSDTSLTNGRQYHYRVTAENSYGESDPSNEVTDTTPLPDFGFTATAGSRQIDLDWTGDNNPDGTLRVYRNGGQYADLGVDSSSFLDDGLYDGIEHTYYIERDTGDVSQTSSTLSAITDLPSPSLTATFGSRQVDLDWTLNDNNPNGEVIVYRGGGSLATISDLATTVYSDTGLLDGTEYVYYVDRDTGDATSASSSITGITNLPAVTDLTVDDISGRYVTISWTDPSNNSSGYRLLLKKPSDASYNQDGTDYDPVAEDETKTVTTTELLDGQQYDATVETFTSDTSTREDQ